MVDGTYNVTVKIPFGALDGTVTLSSEGGACTAQLELNGVRQQAEGTVTGEDFAFGGTADTPLGALSYDISGTADGETLSAVAKTKMGSFTIAGTRA